MKKYFYTDGIEKFGPFSFEELKRLNLTRETKIWYYGLENWTTLSKIEELQSITKTIPPKLKVNEASNTTHEFETTTKPPSIKKNEKPKPKNKRSLKRIATISIILLFSILIVYIIGNNQKENKLYQNISSSAFEANVDFDFYVKKFYRDVEVFGIFPKKPKTTIIKFAKLDQLTNATHIHGISYGMNDDDRIEIYINPSTWESFNKPMRYYLMYHELSHDVLNVDDLKDLPSNEGKLMYPAIATYESKTMDDFIESSHELFEEVAAKQNY